MIHRTAAILLAALALSGCVAVWGRGYNIESKTPDRVTIKYDRHFSSPDEVKTVAQASCNGYGRKAVRQNEATSMWGLTTVSFRCVAG